MQNKILFVSNTANFSKFNRPFMQWFKAQGWQVDYVSYGEENVLDCDVQYKINLARSPFSLKNFKACQELEKIIEENNYQIIHCHTPMGGVLARLAAKKLRKQGKTKVIYTAHGFHFYKGAPLLNWLFYYPTEKYLARFTDVLITINDEDNMRAKKMSKNVYKIDGVGVNLERFKIHSEVEKKALRKEFGYSENDFIITVVAELNKNKNQIMLAKVARELKNQIPSLKILLIGKETLPIMRNFVAENHLDDCFEFLGYRRDVDKLTACSDIAFSSSLREGLPINIIEAMACGIPVVCSENRGHISLIKEPENGFLFNPADSKKMKNSIIDLYKNPILRKQISERNVIESKKYSVDIAINKMAEIYKTVMQ